ncbi:hypothetical protein RN001_016017 [Aquatica leii]|uniref:Uncharacterized protein n=1 Tax=Aquatica leii TaxID=1421715 RepID=A0AAN7QB08_9COLE|nr:hypothetical protein RN001_016017 [Aquatica leii]
MKVKKSGSGSDEIYETKWEFFSALQFMFLHTEDTRTTNSIRLVAFAKHEIKHPVAAFIDIHGHSKKKSVFLYGCNPKLSWDKIDKKKGDSSDLLSMTPTTIHTINPNMQLSSCQNRIRKHKESTARVVFWREFDIEHSYTLECTYSEVANKLVSKYLIKITLRVVVSRMSTDEVAGPSSSRLHRAKVAKLDYYCGLTESEVRILSKHEYLLDSEEEPFSGSESEYIPSSGDESNSFEEGPESDQEVTKETVEAEAPQDEFPTPEVVVGHDELQFLWGKQDFIPEVHEYDSSNSGITNETLREKREIDFFLNLFTEDIATTIVEETNRFKNGPPANVRTRQHNIIIKLPVLKPSAMKLGNCPDPEEVWRHTNKKITALQKHYKD